MKNTSPYSTILKFISLDLSTKATGVAVFDGQKLVHFECLRESDADVYRRMVRMAERVENIIVKNHISKAIIEDVPLGGTSLNCDVSRKLCVLQGMLIYMFERNGVAFDAYQPTRWRQLMGFNQTAYTCRNCSQTFIHANGVYRGTCPSCGKGGKNQFAKKTMNGREEMKTRAVDYVNREFGLQFVYYKNETKAHISNDNEAEAICMGIAYSKYLKGINNE